MIVESIIHTSFVGCSLPSIDVNWLLFLISILAEHIAVASMQALRQKLELYSFELTDKYNT